MKYCFAYLPFLSLILLFSACEDLDKFYPDTEDVRLPMYTTEGNNIAGCYINNEVWTSTLSNADFCLAGFILLPGNCAENSGNITLTEDGFELKINREMKSSPLDNELLLFSIKDNVAPQDSTIIDYLRGKQYELTGENFARLTDLFSQTLEGEYPNQQTQSGTLTFSNETTGNIIAGTFYFKNTYDGGVIECTKGRFDYNVRN